MKRLAILLALAWLGGSAEGFAQSTASDEHQYAYVAYLRVPRSEIGNLEELIQRRILPVLGKNNNAINDEYSVVIEATRIGFLVRIMTMNPPVETLARLRNREMGDIRTNDPSISAVESVDGTISPLRPIRSVQNPTGLLPE